MRTFICEIVTPESLLFSEEAYFVAVPATQGEIGILARRAPIMSTLKLGVVRVKKDEQAEPISFAVAGGYFEADGRKVVVLADRAEAMAKMSLDSVRAARVENEKSLAALDADDSRAAFHRDEVAWFKLLEAQLEKRQ